MRTFVLSTLAMLAFAGNSVLCRLALAEQQIDPSSFSGIRLLSGAVMLVLLIAVSPNQSAAQGNTRNLRRSLFAALMLFTYALFFSYAYLSLDAATGALVLFGVVQTTLVIISIVRGKTPHTVEWLGLFVACAGFVYLLLPELNSPTFFGLLMMSIAGVAWAFYTAVGQGSLQPLMDTKTNFVYSIPLVVVLALVCLLLGVDTNATVKGLLLAVSSGAITSAVGYVIWYAVLPKLATMVAAVMQLTVPVIAAVLGLFLVNEIPTTHLVVSGVIILFGIFLVIVAPKKAVKNGSSL